MKISIHNAVSLLIEADAREVILPGEDGELSVMAFHQNCLCNLRAGQVRVTLTNPSDNETVKRFPLKKGLAIIGSDNVSVLIED